MLTNPEKLKSFIDGILGRSGQWIAGSGSGPRQKNQDLEFTTGPVGLITISIAAAGESVICYV